MKPVKLRMIRFFMQSIEENRLPYLLNEEKEVFDKVVKYEELKAVLLKKEKELNGKQKSFITQAVMKQDEIIDALDNAKEVLEDKKEALKSKSKTKK